MPVAVVAAATATARSGCCRQRAAATAASLVVAGAGGGARRGVVPGRQWRRYYYCYRRSSRRCVSGSNYGYCDTGSSSGNTNCRHFSTRVDGDTTGEDAAANAGGSTAKAEQPFVQTRLQAGEWDEDRTDPLYRPVICCCRPPRTTTRPLCRRWNRSGPLNLEDAPKIATSCCERPCHLCPNPDSLKSRETVTSRSP